MQSVKAIPQTTQATTASFFSMGLPSQTMMDLHNRPQGKGQQANKLNLITMNECSERTNTTTVQESVRIPATKQMGGMGAP